MSHLNSIDPTDDWYIFTIDPTMNAIVNLFRKRADSKGGIFEGIIQIFNITNVMSPNVNEALKLYQSSSNPLKTTWEDDIKNIISPIYIGWGNFYRNNLVKDIATSLLSAISEIEDIEYLERAGFIHPLYLMLYGAHNPKCIATQASFHNRF